MNQQPDRAALIAALRSPTSGRMVTTVDGSIRQGTKVITDVAALRALMRQAAEALATLNSTETERDTAKLDLRKAEAERDALRQAAEAAEQEVLQLKARVAYTRDFAEEMRQEAKGWSTRAEAAEREASEAVTETETLALKLGQQQAENERLREALQSCEKWIATICAAFSIGPLEANHPLLKAHQALAAQPEVKP